MVAGDANFRQGEDQMAETAPNLFGSIAKEDKLNLFNDDVPDGKKVVELLKYKKSDVSRATAISPKSVRYDSKMPALLKEHLTQWATALNLVASFFDDEHKTILWFNTANPLLGNVSPKAMIRAGRFDKLLRFIQIALEENTR